MTEVLRCEECNHELSYCGREGYDGPELDCRVCKQQTEIERFRARLAAAEAALHDSESDHQMFIAIAGNQMQMVTVNINSKALDCGLPVAETWDAEAIMRVQDAVFDNLGGKIDGWALEVDQIHAELRDCRSALYDSETALECYKASNREFQDTAQKRQQTIVRLEELLREAGDFMTPHAHADWKKKLETARGAK